ncbi:MAG: DUF885 domain-containing protein [Chitinophagaceae bacterium]
MKQIIFATLLLIGVISCNQKGASNNSEVNSSDTSFSKLLNDYYDQRMKLYPLEATQNGDNRYNDQLPINISDAYKDTLKDFYLSFQNALSGIDTSKLNANDFISYKIFSREMKMQIEGLDLNLMAGEIQNYYMPFQQFWGLPITMGQLGAGESYQPFKTEKDYNNWLSRIQQFSIWCDSAIAQFTKGMNAEVILPKALVLKMIPQMEAMTVKESSKNIFYGPIKKFPSEFNDSIKISFIQKYKQAVDSFIIPSYQKLASFFKDKYLPAARSTSGIKALPNGEKIYNYLIRYWTTTNKTSDEIYNTGISEVKRIRSEMEKIKESVGFKGDLKEFFDFMKTDKKFMPYKTPEEVLIAFRDIQKRIDPNLKSMFGRTPKTTFEIRQTEAFRAASASAEYNQGLADGSRPGIFYVPIIDATKFNSTSGMESLFLHEAIPGHHYQVSLQQENESLPKFRRFAWYGAMGEGWALYCESLGKELGLYTDPYQYMGALGDEIHRAIRLVVDVGIHVKGMTREEAIKYMMENEAITEEGAIAEIERYMAIPGQALSYKIGALKIRELREKYINHLGSRFNLAAFHDELLKDGVMPLDVMESKMDAWANKIK